MSVHGKHLLQRATNTKSHPSNPAVLKGSESIYNIDISAGANLSEIGIIFSRGHYDVLKLCLRLNVSNFTLIKQNYYYKDVTIKMGKPCDPENTCLRSNRSDNMITSSPKNTIIDQTCPTKPRPYRQPGPSLTSSFAARAPSNLNKDMR